MHFLGRPHRKINRFCHSIIPGVKKVAIDAEGDGRRAMTEPAADFHNVHAGGNQRRRMRGAVKRGTSHEAIQAPCRHAPNPG